MIVSVIPLKLISLKQNPPKSKGGGFPVVLKVELILIHLNEDGTRSVMLDERSSSYFSKAN